MPMFILISDGDAGYIRLTPSTVTTYEPAAHMDAAPPSSAFPPRHVFQPAAVRGLPMPCPASAPSARQAHTLPASRTTLC